MQHLGSDGKASCLQFRRPGFNPWVGKISWRRQWHPTPVLLLGKSHGRKSLVGYSPWGCKESDTTEQLHFHLSAKLCITGIHGIHNSANRRRYVEPSCYVAGGNKEVGSIPKLMDSNLSLFQRTVTINIPRSSCKDLEMN